MKEDLQYVDPEMLSESIDYESWLLNVEASITFKGKTLEEWSKIVSVPTIIDSSELSPNEVEILNQRIYNLTETIMTNLALTKVSFLDAEARHKIALNEARRALQATYEAEGKRLPSESNLSIMCENACIKTFKIMIRSSMLYEFFNVHSFKLNRLDSRLTSISIAKKT